MDTEDLRPLHKLTLAQVDTGEKRPAEEGSIHIVPVIATDETLRKRTLDILQACGASVAQSIVNLGCTGLASFNFTVDDIKLVRAGLAGSGVGLPCYVGPDHYCLGHETIGGLQDGQAPRHVAHAAAISRDLRPDERAHMVMVDTARRADGGPRAVADALAGRRTSDAFLHEVTNVLDREPREIDTPAPTPAPVPVAAPPVQVTEAPFTCPDHATSEWHCRYCIAEAIVKGPLSPSFLMGHAEIDGTVLMEDMNPVEGHAIEERIAKFDEGGALGAVLFVKVARWRRKLARD